MLSAITAGPAPESTAATPQRRSSARYSAEAGIADARCGWCRTILGGLHQQVGPLGQRHHQQRGAAQIEPGVGVADLIGQQDPRLGGRRALLRDRGEEHGCRGAAAAAPPRSVARTLRRSVQDTTAPPSTAAAALSGWPSNSEDSWTSSDSVSGVEPACATRPLAAARPPTTAAADEPSPRECGMSLRQRTFSPLTDDAGCLQPALDGPHHQVGRVQRNLPAPSPSTSTMRPESVVSTTISS